MKNKLLFSTDFENIDLKYALPFACVSSIVLVLLLTGIMPWRVMVIKVGKVNIALLLLVIGNMYSLFMLYKLVLRNKILCCLGQTLSMFLAAVFSIASIFIPTYFKIIAIIISILLVSSDEKYRNPLILENIVVSAIRFFNLSYIIAEMMLFIKHANG